MTAMTVGEKIQFMERLRTSVPVNRQTSLVVARASGWWNQQNSRDPLEFLSRRPQMCEAPHYVKSLPDRIRDLTGMKKGCLVVVGYISMDEKRRLGWTGKGNWAVRCQCGRYEHRSQRDLRRAIKKEYGDACTWCKNIWAEYVKAQFKKTGKWPVGGGPTHRASQF